MTDNIISPAPPVAYTKTMLRACSTYGQMLSAFLAAPEPGEPDEYVMRQRPINKHNAIPVYYPAEIVGNIVILRDRLMNIAEICFNRNINFSLFDSDGREFTPDLQNGVSSANSIHLRLKQYTYGNTIKHLEHE